MVFWIFTLKLCIFREVTIKYFYLLACWNQIASGYWDVIKMDCLNISFLANCIYFLRMTKPSLFPSFHLPKMKETWPKSFIRHLLCSFITFYTPRSSPMEESQIHSLHHLPPLFILAPLFSSFLPLLLALVSFFRKNPTPFLLWSPFPPDHARNSNLF